MVYYPNKEPFMRRSCMFGICVFFVLGAMGSVSAVQPEKAKAPVTEIPVGALTSSNPPQGPIWVHATIVEQTDDDTFLIKDRSGQITLFLPTDSLMALDLKPGMDLLILGTVDVSPVRSDKNEFYAERILLPQ